MSQQTYYRKYRPRILGEVIGQHMPVRTLKNALNRNEIAHAYLFHGPRGTGKTSVARIMARSLNCEQGLGPEPCGVCDNCTDILKGLHPEVVEMDAASHSRVEEIRRLLEQLWVPRTRSRFKIYILDEVHMLSTSAFNALLKNVEEPPPGLVFILATTEPHKVPATIRSRCQEYAFGRVAPADMGPALTAIMEKENLKAEDGVLEELCRASEGCMRDSLSLLQQVASTSDGLLELQSLRLLSGRLGDAEIKELIGFLEKKDGETLLARFEGYYTSGRNLQTIVQELRHAISQSILKGQDKTSLGPMVRWLDRLDQRLAYERDPMLAMESGLARWIAGELAPVLAAPSAPASAPAAMSGRSAPSGESAPRSAPAPRPPPAKDNEFARPAPAAQEIRPSGQWETFVKSLMKKDVPLMAMLSQTQGIVEGGTLRIIFPAKWRMDALEKQGKKATLEAAASEFFETPLSLALEVAGATKGAPLEVTRSKTIAAPVPKEAPAAKTPLPRPTPKPTHPDRAEDQGLIDRVMTLWPGSTVEDPPGGPQ